MPRGTYNHISATDWQRIVDSAENGEDWRHLVRQLNINEKTAYSWVRTRAGTSSRYVSGHVLLFVIMLLAIHALRNASASILHWRLFDLALTLQCSIQLRPFGAKWSQLSKQGWGSSKYVTPPQVGAQRQFVERLIDEAMPTVTTVREILWMHVNMHKGFFRPQWIRKTCQLASNLSM